MDRSRGGLTTKIHALTNEKGLPLKIVLTPGTTHDLIPAKELLSDIGQDMFVLADKAFDADWLRRFIWEKGSIDVIPYKANRKCPGDFDKETYRKRNAVERFFGRIKKSFRRIATRYDKYSTHFFAMIQLASIRLWAKFYESTT